MCTPPLHACFVVLLLRKRKLRVVRAAALALFQSCLDGSEAVVFRGQLIIFCGQGFTMRSLVGLGNLLHLLDARGWIFLFVGCLGDLKQGAVVHLSSHRTETGDTGGAARGGKSATETAESAHFPRD